MTGDSPRTGARRLMVGLAATTVAATGVALFAGVPSYSSVSSPGSLYVDTQTSAAAWVADNPNDPKASVIADRIASRSVARWFGDWNGDPRDEVSEYVARAEAAGAVPTLVVYNIPDRDCGNHSAGGAVNFAEYDAWIARFASALGDGPAIVMLEPDAIALNACAGSDRNGALARAVRTIKGAGDDVRVYLDAGHSDWVGAEEIASRLEDAGVRDGDGFYTNMSNYRSTPDEAAFGLRILDALGNSDDLGQIIDVSRNGNGPAPDGQWCDPAGRAVGADPTLDTGIGHVDALLWAKPPGEADGCRAAAGTFVPDIAYELVVNAGGASTPRPTATPSATPSATRSATPSATPSATQSATQSATPSGAPSATGSTTAEPTSPGGGQGSCRADYRVTKEWDSGFRAEVDVTGANRGWELTWTFSSGERIERLWDGGLTSSGSSVRVRNADWNASGDATVGFVATGDPGPVTVTCR
ncbi:MAG: glycoside hydrolase family 6 protein [Kineosporiaceae bacterium]